jgi:hypothetical protein
LYNLVGIVDMLYNLVVGIVDMLYNLFSISK